MIALIAYLMFGIPGLIICILALLACSGGDSGRGTYELPIERELEIQRAFNPDAYYEIQDGRVVCTGLKPETQIAEKVTKSGLVATKTIDGAILWLN